MFFTDSHEWVFVEKERAIVGITGFAQKELGEVVYVELPKVGEVVEKGSEVCVLESTKSAADIYAPITGKITKINEALKESPKMLNEDPEGKGWLFEVDFSSKEQLEGLLSKEEYQALIS